MSRYRAPAPPSHLLCFLLSSSLRCSQRRPPRISRSKKDELIRKARGFWKQKSKAAVGHKGDRRVQLYGGTRIQSPFGDPRDRSWDQSCGWEHRAGHTAPVSRPCEEHLGTSPKPSSVSSQGVCGKQQADDGLSNFEKEQGRRPEPPDLKSPGCGLTSSSPGARSPGSSALACDI